MHQRADGATDGKCTAGKGSQIRVLRYQPTICTALHFATSRESRHSYQGRHATRPIHGCCAVQSFPFCTAATLPGLPTWPNGIVQGQIVPITPGNCRQPSGPFGDLEHRCPSHPLATNKTRSTLPHQNTIPREVPRIRRRPEGPVEMATLVGKTHIRGSTETARMMLLTFATIGITFTWGIEMTYCTPYLLNLALTKSNTSIIWIAGPLSGLLVQPVVGVIADENTSKWGRRRPLMVVGAAIVAVSLLVLGFTREIVGLLGRDDEQARRPTIILAVLAIYVVDFAINVATDERAVMSCSRSLVVDTLPLARQQTGAAWGSRMSAVGHMVGYAAGSIDLVQTFGTTMGDAQFKQLTVIAALAILASTAVTCWAVTERVLVSPRGAKEQSIMNVLRQIYTTIRHLPPRIQAICWAQFWSWIGWFPFLFYSTTWIGETYFRYDVPADAKQSKDTLGDMGRIGSTSLFIYSGITFAGAFFLPMLVKSPDDEGFTKRPPQFIAGLVRKFNDRKPDILMTWIYGHVMFAAAMSFAPLATSFRFATALVCLCGLPWTIAMWAPTTLLGVEVNKLSGATQNGASYRRMSYEPDIELPTVSPSDAPVYLENSQDATAAGMSTSAELSGIYFGILNIYTTLPQFVGTFIASIVFAVLEPGKSPELAADADPNKVASGGGPNAISVCLFIGAMSSVVAAFATRKLKYL
ncbi:General alpha-glucoside permease [Tolypocladium ophioglossoides CBS 100239]|uniref:General alpha-glucoside permease n=1 Tax=Tolypocladium ophioglossoides (strain CBS 100239) TaxID=1163406 RepID=A0A0L0N5S6_TOLOC|nr:General alpha-glucoside permease [Tolypocladium ophioglossoides CBS 100239]